MSEGNKKNNNARVAGALQSKLSNIKKSFLYIISTKTIRLLVVLFFVLITAWLLYAQTWLPMQAEVDLPPGVTTRSPQVNEEILLELHAERSDRVRFQPSSFIHTNRYFRDGQ